MSVRSPRRPLAALAGGLALLAAAACGSASTGASGGSFASAPGDRPRVLAAFYPLEWVSRRVGGADVELATLTSPGVEPHDLELTPRQIADIEQADLIVYLKGVQPAVDEAVAEHAADRSFDVAAAVTTLPATGADPHGEEEGHEGEEAHEEVGYDPHLWLDPSRFATVATKLGERLAQADAPHAAGFRSRAAAAAAELNAVDKELSDGLRTCASRTIVTSHAAFGYLADRYRLKQVGISGIDPESEPSPARLAEVAKVAKQEKVTTIFTEELVNPKVAEVLATEVGAKTAVLNPIESRPATGDYLSATRDNLAHLRTALGCT
ncbi:metal ABC transporter substrate-binding protein [Thermopolyspora sp. NPDC052614]|uniref:metal ABC transporter substrate-binding protein n=1 Tax=Thermopolyspora sp. NPDC052614 TaxID=3155682 RepID=UPI00343152B9